MRIVIRENERGLLFKHGKYVKMLRPGLSTLWGSGWEIEKVETEARFHPEKGILDAFLEDPELRSELQIFSVSENSRGLLFKDGLYQHVLDTGIHVFLGKRHSVDIVPLDAKFAPPRGHIESYIDDVDLSMELQVYCISDNERGLLFKNGCFQEMLAPGQYAYLGKRFTLMRCQMESAFECKNSSLETFQSDSALTLLLQVYDIQDQEIGLLFHRNSFIKSLKSGRHLYLGEFFSLHKAPIHAVFDSLGLNISVFQKDVVLASMLMVFDLKDDERGMLFKDSLFIKMLTPGRHAFLGKSFSMITVKLGEEFLPGQADYELFCKDSALSQLLHIFDVMEDQCGLLYKNNIFIKMLRPGRYAFLGDNHRLTLVSMDEEFPSEISNNAEGKQENRFEALLSDPNLASILRVCHINKEQRGLLFAHGAFQKMLSPGIHAYIGKKYSIEIADIHKAFPLGGRDPAIFLEDASLAGELNILEVADGYVTLHFQNGCFCEGLPKGCYAFWTNMDKHTFQTVSIQEPMVNDDVPSYVFQAMSSSLFQRFELQDYEKGQLYYDGKYIKLLDGGSYYFWNNGIHVQVIGVDTRLQQMSIQGQELLTLDKVSVRVNCVCRYKISNYELINRAIQDYQEQIHVLVQLALREYIGAAVLDELLENKGQISARLLNQLKEKEAECYVTFLDTGIKDIILPGSIKDIMQSVLKAEKQAQANVITRREEVASTRSLLNTAKLLDENQTLMHLKDMEYQERQRTQMMECAERIAASLGDKVTGISIQGSDLFEQIKGLINKTKLK